MKKIKIIFISIVLIACGQKGDHSHHNTEAPTDNANQILYNQVMDIHDEVMPKTENIYNISKGLKASLKKAKTDLEKQQLQARIAYLDSVNQMMMDWMHDFKPLPDSTKEETARAYYEDHLERVKKVKEAILTALEKEKN